MVGVAVGRDEVADLFGVEAQGTDVSRMAGALGPSPASIRASSPPPSIYQVHAAVPVVGGPRPGDALDAGADDLGIHAGRSTPGPNKVTGQYSTRSRPLPA